MTKRRRRGVSGRSRGDLGRDTTPDGRRAVSGSGGGTLMVWDLETGRAVLTLPGHNRGGDAVAVAPDGRRVVSASDRTLKMWDLETGHEVGLLRETSLG